MYNKSELCAKIDNVLTSNLYSQIEVNEGDILNPNLFKIFIKEFNRMH